MTPRKRTKNTMNFKLDAILDEMRLASEQERSLEVVVMP